MKAVIITVNTLQRDENGQEESIELTTKGTYEKQGDVQILCYDESSLTGLTGTRTTVRSRSNRNFCRERRKNHCMRPPLATSR